MIDYTDLLRRDLLDMRMSSRDPDVRMNYDVADNYARALQKYDNRARKIIGFSAGAGDRLVINYHAIDYRGQFIDRQKMTFVFEQGRMQ